MTEVREKYTCRKCNITQFLYGDTPAQTASCGEPWCEWIRSDGLPTGFCDNDDCKHGEACHPSALPKTPAPLRKWWQFWRYA